MLDITHEALIRQWKTLRQWVDKEAGSAGVYARLKDTALIWQAGKAGLWRSPDLDLALKWRQEENPNPAWAERYGGEFDTAIAFLEQSQAAAMEEERQKNEAKEQKAKSARTRWLLKWAVVMLCIVLAFSGWALVSRSQAVKAKQTATKAEQATKDMEQKRTVELFESRLTHASLLARGEDYARAKEILSSSRELDQSVPESRQHARNLLDWYAHLMGSGPVKTYEGAGAKLLEVEISPDGKALAACGERGTVVLVDTESGKVIRRLKGHDETANVIDPQGRWLASGGDDKRIIFRSMSEGKKQWENAWQRVL